jgi:hypothetical protein
VGVDEEGIRKHTSSLHVRKQVRMPVARGKRVLPFDYLVPSGVVGESRITCHCLYHHAQELKE